MPLAVTSPGAPRSVTWLRARVRPALGVAFGSFVVIGVTDAVLGAAWPSIRHSLHLPIGDLGLVQVVGTTGFMISSAVSGRTSARLGRARVLAAAAATGVGALSAFATASGLVALLVAAFAVGLAGGQIETGMQSHVALSARARTMNFLHGCYGIGATLGPLLLSALLLAHASWRLTYVVLVAIEATVAGGVLRRRHTFEETGPRRARRAGATGAGGTAPPAALPRAALASALTLFFVYCGVEVGTGQWAFTLLTTGRHLGTGTAGVLVASYWGALTGVRFAVAALGERIDHEILLVVAAAATLAGEALLWWDPVPLVGAAGLVLTGAALAPAFPLMMARTTRWADLAHVATVIGWQSAAASLGIAVLSGCAALLVQRLGLGVLGPYLTALGAAFLLLQLVAVRSGARRRALSPPR